MQADASVEDDARRDAYLMEADLREKDKDAAGEMDAFARGLAAYPDDSGLLYARCMNAVDQAATGLPRSTILSFVPDISTTNPDPGYRIASSPWNNQYYAAANTFMNGDPWGGPYTHNTDFAVANC